MGWGFRQGIGCRVADEELEVLRGLYSSTRCNNVFMSQDLGELECGRMPGHVGDHCDLMSGKRWD